MSQRLRESFSFFFFFFFFFSRESILPRVLVSLPASFSSPYHRDLHAVLFFARYSPVSVLFHATAYPLLNSRGYSLCRAAVLPTTVASRPGRTFTNIFASRSSETFFDPIPLLFVARPSVQTIHSFSVRAWDELVHLFISKRVQNRYDLFPPYEFILQSFNNNMKLLGETVIIIFLDDYIGIELRLNRDGPVIEIFWRKKECRSSLVRESPRRRGERRNSQLRSLSSSPRRIIYGGVLRAGKGCRKKGAQRGVRMRTPRSVFAAR